MFRNYFRSSIICPFLIAHLSLSTSKSASSSQIPNVFRLLSRVDSTLYQTRNVTKSALYHCFARLLSYPCYQYISLRNQGINWFLYIFLLHNFITELIIIFSFITKQNKNNHRFRSLVHVRASHATMAIIQSMKPLRMPAVKRWKSSFRFVVSFVSFIIWSAIHVRFE